jgi:predicted thioesterase
MKATLAAGLDYSMRIEVDDKRTIAFLGEDSKVYATPFVLYDVEVASRMLINEHLDETEDTVGISATINHMAATPLGMWVEVKVRITAVAGRKVDLAFECRDDADVIAKGVHSRFVVNKEKTAAQIRAKAQQYG